MKLCNFIFNDQIHVGALSEDGLADLTAAGLAPDMNMIISGGSGKIEEIKGHLAKGNLPLSDPPEVEFACVTKPGKILCVGLNYKSHAAETGGQVPAQPVLFNKFNDALCPAGADVSLPQWQRCYDYEAELVIVIGKTAWNVSEAQAADYIFGYTCGNDLSARDCQFVSGQWLIGKTFPGFAPAGPYIVTADSFDPCDGHSIVCRINGITVQTGNTNDMIFSCAEIVSYASRYLRLEPGDLIFTGTPAGVILGQPKGSRVWLKAGDTTQVEIDGIGTLTNTLI